MNTIPSFLKRPSFVLFVLLAYLISWSLVLPTRGLLLPWGPMLAALLILGLTQGRAGVKALRNRVSNPRPGLGWYGVAVAIPVVITLAVAGLNILLGARVSQSFDWSLSLRSLPLLLLVGGQWEEPGWTGFALPELMRRFSKARFPTLTATLILAIVRLGWHLPLMIYGHIYWSDMVMIIASQIVMTWLFKNARHSVLVIMLLHLVNNMIFGQVFQSFFSGPDWVMYYWLNAILWSLLAFGLLALDGPNLVRREAPAAPDNASLGQPLA